MKNDYLIDINDLKNLTITQVINKLSEMPGIKLRNCTIADLVFFGENPIYSGNGVYIFKENENFIYVGNCVARNFVERIPAHFDIRIEGWFNSLLMNIIKKKYNSEHKTNELLTTAAKYAFDNYSLILINYSIVDYNRESIDKLETTLRIFLKPYNSFKRKELCGNRDLDKLSQYI